VSGKHETSRSWIRKNKKEAAIAFLFVRGDVRPRPEAPVVDSIQPMPQSPAERQKAFKESMKQAGMVRLEAWVTKEQREKFRQLGGDAWLRERIKRAKPEDKK
jgi:hypothetical protein